MIQRHWENLNTFEHFGRGDFGMLGWDALKGPAQLTFFVLESLKPSRLSWFRYQVARIWRKWLARRSRLRRMNWERMNELLKRYPLPPVSYMRSWQCP